MSSEQLIIVMVFHYYKLIQQNVHRSAVFKYKTLNFRQFYIHICNKKHSTFGSLLK